MVYLNAIDSDTVREDFAGLIFDYSPTDKVIQAFSPVLDNYNIAEYSWMLDHVDKPTAIHNTDTLSTGWSDSEAGLVGGDFPEDQQERVRIDNVQMIERRKVEVTRSKRSIDEAGIEDEYAYQHLREGRRLLQQVEFDLHWSDGFLGSGTNDNPGGTSTASRTAGLAQWIFGSNSARRNTTTFQTTTASSRTLTGTTYGSHCYFDATVGAKPAMGEAGWNDLWNSAYAEGLNASDTVIICGGRVKRHLSGFQVAYQGGGVVNLTGAAPGSMDATQIRVNQMMDKRSVTMDFYASDFGVIAIAIDRYMEDTQTFTYHTDGGGGVANPVAIIPNECFMGFDPANVAIPMLDPYFQTPLAKTKDQDESGVGVEFGLRVGNPLGCVGGVNVLGTAS